MHLKYANRFIFYKEESVGAAYFDLAVAKGVYRKAVELGSGIKVDM
ncbi:hypothetical protein ACFOZY_09090 [Chungangia koreensis]|uniref:Uncharacterized protein n=1 Tax=Chungangia koreensis TaxID=752657 RepID=A0ABV8X4Z0_9LACT